MSCVSTPTATQFSTVVSSSVSTSFSEQVTSLPDTTSTQLITSCLSSADLSISDSSLGIGTCVSSTVITSTTVVDGGVSTTQVPFQITNFVTSTVPTNTLFAPCSSTHTSTSTSTSSSTTTSQPPSTQFSDTSSTVIVTPTTTITSSQASTLSNGQVTQIVVTLTSALPPTDSVITSSVPIATTQANDGDGGSSALGPIIGGTLGGLAGLLAVIAAVWFFRRRRVSFDEIFEKDYEEYKGHPVIPSRGRMLDLEDDPIPVHPLEANTQPKPYVYGLVGAQPPVSLDAAIVPAAGTSRPESVASHTRTSSTAPLMNNSPASRPGSAGDSNHGGGGTPGVSPSPSFTPSATAGARSTSPGPLGVQIPTGPAFTEPLVGGGESPTSVTGPRGPLFVANALDRDSPPGTPRPATPLAGTAKRSSLAVSNVASGLSAPASAPAPSGPPAPPSPYAPPPAALAYLAEKHRLQRNDTMSSGSVYSQPSRAPTPPLSRALSDQTRQSTGSGVVVHKDAGPIAKAPSDQPPAYQG